MLNKENGKQVDEQVPTYLMGTLPRRSTSHKERLHSTRRVVVITGAFSMGEKLMLIGIFAVSDVQPR